MKPKFTQKAVKGVFWPFRARKGPKWGFFGPWRAALAIFAILAISPITAAESNFHASKNSKNRGRKNPINIENLMK